MAARLALSAVSLGFALVLEAAGDPFTTAEWRGFYGTVAFAFFATMACGAARPWVRNSRRFALINVGMDIGIASALVHFSGGADSAFTFLYVLVAVYGAILFGARGAMASAVLAAAAYGVVLFGGALPWFRETGIGPPTAGTMLLTLWTVHAGAIVVVAALASLLTAELRRTGEALDQRTSDLARLANLHRRMVDSLMSGLLTTDREGRITSFNPEAARISGVPEVRAIGRDVDAVLPGIAEQMSARDREGSEQHPRTRMRFRDPEGRDLHLGIATYVLKDEKAAPDGHVIIFQDVTNVVEMEEDLRRSERLAAVGELSASIAHEIRNPLASISGSIQLLRSQLPQASGEGDPRQLMEIVLRETDRLNHLITDFLYYARPGPRVLAPVPLEDAVGEVLKMFESIRAENVEVRREVEEDLSVTADAGQLRQILWNLVLNATEAMEGGGTLTVSAASVRNSQEDAGDGRKVAKDGKKPSLAEIVVSDQGTGIRPDVRDRIFDPFFTTKTRGSGLGLATVHRIVEGHGGSIRVESTVGTGTVVKLRLPATGAGE